MKKIAAFLVGVFLFLPVFRAQALVNSLNGLTALTQTFANGTNVIITSAGSTHTIGWTGTLQPSRGGTGTASLTTNGVLYGNGSSAIQATAVGTSGQLLLGSGAAPAFATLSGDASITNTGVLTVSSNAVTLGNDTTGNYIATISGSPQIVVSGSGVESAPVSLSLAVDSIGATELNIIDGNVATDENCLTYESGGANGTFEWQSCGGGVNIGSTISGGSQGSVLFVGTSSALSQDNSNFFWDDTNNKLRLGGNINFASNSTPIDGIIKVVDQTSGGINGNHLKLYAGSGLTGDIPSPGDGGDVVLTAGTGRYSTEPGGIGPGGNPGILTVQGGRNSGNGGQVNITGGNSTAALGASLEVTGAQSGTGGQIIMRSGNGSEGGNFQFFGGNGGLGAGTTGQGGSVILTAGNGKQAAGGDIRLKVGQGIGTPTWGKFIFYPKAGTTAEAILNFDSITGPGAGNGAEKTFTFQNASGTLPLLQSSQTFSGINTFSNVVNYFVSSSNSTIYVGNEGIPGCIAMGDSDLSGVTYITVNDGVMSASTSKPTNCQ